MKNLIFINGTMGVGKSTTCKELLKLLKNCVFLDGDWCWYADPMIVNEETIDMAEQNIGFLLSNFLSCSAYENVIFCAVMYNESQIENILSLIQNTNYFLHKFSLVCTEKALAERLGKDINGSFRGDNILERASRRLPNFIEMNTIKIDVSEIAPEQAASHIYTYLQQSLKS